MKYRGITSRGMGSSENKFIKNLIRYLRKLADPPDSFQHRQSNKHVVRFMINGQTLCFSFAKTPSDYRARRNISAEIKRELKRVGAIPDRSVLSYLTHQTVQRDMIIYELLKFLESEDQDNS